MGAYAGNPNRVLAILEEKAELPSLEILRRVRAAGYAGGNTGLHCLVASLRPKGIKPLVRFEGLVLHKNSVRTRFCEFFA